MAEARAQYLPNFMINRFNSVYKLFVAGASVFVQAICPIFFLIPLVLKPYFDISRYPQISYIFSPLLNIFTHFMLLSLVKSVFTIHN